MVSTSGQQKTASPSFWFGIVPPYLNMSIYGKATCIAIGHIFPRSVSKSKLSPTLCPLWQPVFPILSITVIFIFGLLIFSPPFLNCKNGSGKLQNRFLEGIIEIFNYMAFTLSSIPLALKTDTNTSVITIPTAVWIKRPGVITIACANP